MARPLRLEYPGALYHIAARGERRVSIFEDDDDRLRFLSLLAQEVQQQGWILYAFCLLNDHYQLLLETPEPNLVRGMRRLNGVYTQVFNRRHGRSGRVLRGRYKATLVEKDRHLLELCCYIVSSALRAKLVRSIERWRWSSYLATAGRISRPQWLAADQVVRLLSKDPAQARRAYVRFVADAMSHPSPFSHLKRQIFLGSEAFVARMQRLLTGEKPRGIVKQRSALRPQTAQVVRAVADAHHVSRAAVLERDSGEPFKHAVYLLRRRANLSLREVAALAGVSIGRVSQIQGEIERGAPDERLKQCLRALDSP
jgi:REP element-mobilizing transposase RayT